MFPEAPPAVWRVLLSSPAARCFALKAAAGQGSLEGLRRVLAHPRMRPWVLKAAAGDPARPAAQSRLGLHGAHS